MNAYKWAAVVVVGWGFGSAIFGVLTGRFLEGLRDYRADYARQNAHRYQQFNVEDRYVNAEIDRIETEFEAKP